MLVGVTLLGLLCLGISTALLCLGVCCEESSLIVPYIARQVRQCVTVARTIECV